MCDWFILFLCSPFLFSFIFSIKDCLFIMSIDHTKAYISVMYQEFFVGNFLHTSKAGIRTGQYLKPLVWCVLYHRLYGQYDKKTDLLQEKIHFYLWYILDQGAATHKRISIMPNLGILRTTFFFLTILHVLTDFKEISFRMFPAHRPCLTE